MSCSRAKCESAPSAPTRPIQPRTHADRHSFQQLGRPLREPRRSPMAIPRASRYPCPRDPIKLKKDELLACGLRRRVQLFSVLNLDSNQKKKNLPRRSPIQTKCTCTYIPPPPLRRFFDTTINPRNLFQNEAMFLDPHPSPRINQRMSFCTHTNFLIERGGSKERTRVGVCMRIHMSPRPLTSRVVQGRSTLYTKSFTTHARTCLLSFLPCFPPSFLKQHLNTEPQGKRPKTEPWKGPLYLNNDSFVKTPLPTSLV